MITNILWKPTYILMYHIRSAIQPSSQNCWRPLVLSCVWFISLLWCSAQVAAWVHNESNDIVYVKPENGTEPLRLRPNEKHHGKQDGLALKGKVYKTCNRCNVVVGSNGTISRISCEGPAANVCQAAEGGWKDKAWIDQHPDWLQLYCAVNFCN